MTDEEFRKRILEVHKKLKEIRTTLEAEPIPLRFQALLDEPDPPHPAAPAAALKVQSG